MGDHAPGPDLARLMSAPDVIDVQQDQGIAFPGDPALHRMAAHHRTASDPALMSEQRRSRDDASSDASYVDVAAESGSPQVRTRSHPDEEEEALSADEGELIVGLAAELNLNESYFDDDADAQQAALSPGGITAADTDMDGEDEDAAIAARAAAAVAAATDPSSSSLSLMPAAASSPSQADAPSFLTPADMLRFQRWMHCFAVVTFDLELGQALECVYPPVPFTDTEKANICFNAFADSNSSSIGDTEYCFRVPWVTGADPRAPGRSKYLFGFVFFRQCKDPSIRRGYFQKSVVLLSERPYVGLFRQLVRMLATVYFEAGHPILESACHTIARWPLATPESPLELPFLGSMLYYTIPSHLNGSIGWGALRKSSFEIAPNQYSISSCATNVFRDCREVLSDLWTAWELALIAEPLVVMSTTPSLCADVVLGLLALISPVPFGGDFRPYFTIHDSDFKEYTTKTRPPANVLLGVTNPYFVKAFEHWPHTLRVGAGPAAAGGKRRQSGSLDFTPGMRTSYERCVAVDKRLLKSLLDRNMDEDSANALLLNHFQELTTAFLRPIEHYFASLVPSSKCIGLFEPLPRLKPFEASAFVHGLEKTPNADLKGRIKGNAIELYRRFIRSPNFVAWLRDKTRQENRMLRKIYVKTIIDVEPSPDVLAGQPDSALADLLDRVQHELNSFTCRAWVGEAGVARLESLAVALRTHLQRASANGAPNNASA